MSDYISREAAIKKIRVAADCAECDGNSSDLCGCNFCAVYNAICLIKSLPAANVEPVRPTGHWEIDDGRNHCHCTNCFFGRNIRTQIGWDYCPSCGSKMDLEEK